MRTNRTSSWRIVISHPFLATFGSRQDEEVGVGSQEKETLGGYSAGDSEFREGIGRARIGF